MQNNKKSSSVKNQQSHFNVNDKYKKASSFSTDRAVDEMKRSQNEAKKEYYTTVYKNIGKTDSEIRASKLQSRADEARLQYESVKYDELNGLEGGSHDRTDKAMKISERMQRRADIASGLQTESVPNDRAAVTYNVFLFGGDYEFLEKALSRAVINNENIHADANTEQDGVRLSDDYNFAMEIVADEASIKLINSNPILSKYRDELLRNGGRIISIREATDHAISRMQSRTTDPKESEKFATVLNERLKHVENLLLQGYFSYAQDTMKSISACSANDKDIRVKLEADSIALKAVSNEAIERAKNGEDVFTSYVNNIPINNDKIKTFTDSNLAIWSSTPHVSYRVAEIGYDQNEKLKNKIVDCYPLGDDGKPDFSSPKRVSMYSAFYEQNKVGECVVKRSDISQSFYRVIDIERNKIRYITKIPNGIKRKEMSKEFVLASDVSKNVNFNYPIMPGHQSRHTTSINDIGVFASDVKIYDQGKKPWIDKPSCEVTVPEVSYTIKPPIRIATDYCKSEKPECDKFKYAEGNSNHDRNTRDLLGISEWGDKSAKYCHSEKQDAATRLDCLRLADSGMAEHLNVSYGARNNVAFDELSGSGFSPNQQGANSARHQFANKYCNYGKSEGVKSQRNNTTIARQQDESGIDNTALGIAACAAITLGAAVAAYKNKHRIKRACGAAIGSVFRY